MTPTFEQIRYDVTASVARITLDRPERMNAFTPHMGDELTAAVRHAIADSDVRCIVLTGAGDAFCAGLDIDELSRIRHDDTPAAKLADSPFLCEVPLEIRNSPTPVIAAINGDAVGIGVTMTLPCDLRIAAAEARIGFTFTGLGILPGLGSTHLLPRLVGDGRSRELVLGAQLISGEQAAAIGLVGQAVPRADVLTVAEALAASIAAKDPVVIAAAKSALSFGNGHDMAESIRNERELNAALVRSRRGASSSAAG